jgi:hypothetical protein
VAAAAWTDHRISLDFDRPGARHPFERIPDIDLLVPRSSLHKAKRYAQAARCGEFPVSIDMFWSECWIDFRPGSRFSDLTHHKVRIAVLTELFAPSTVSLLGQGVSAVDPRVLLHMYGTVGVTRRKDVPRTTALTAALSSGALASRFDDYDCGAFTSFMTARSRRYLLFFAVKRSWCCPTRCRPACLRHSTITSNCAPTRSSGR